MRVRSALWKPGSTRHQAPGSPKPTPLTARSTRPLPPCSCSRRTSGRRSGCTFYSAFYSPCISVLEVLVRQQLRRQRRPMVRTGARRRWRLPSTVCTGRPWCSLPWWTWLSRICGPESILSQIRLGFVPIPIKIQLRSLAFSVFDLTGMNHFFELTMFIKIPLTSLTYKCVFTVKDWCVSLAEWIRHNDEAMISRSSSVLSTFQEDLIPAQGESQSLYPTLFSIFRRVLVVLTLKLFNL